MNTSRTAQPRWRQAGTRIPGERPPGRGLRRHGRIQLTLAATAAAGMALATAGPAGAAALAGTSASHLGPANDSWKIATAVRGNDFPNFTAMTVTGRHDAWAFESTSSSTSFLKPIAWRLAAGLWSPASFPGKRGEQVSSASATSPSDVWALANSNQGTRALLFNGNSWSVTGTLMNNFLTDVVALNGHDAWAFGHTSAAGAWHFQAGHWSLVKSGHGLIAGSGLAPGNVWAMGFTTVAHWNGSTWTRTSVKALLPPQGTFNSPRLTSIYAQSSSSVWAVGTAGQESQGGPVVVLHYDGHHWARAALANVCCGFPGQVIADGSGGLWMPYGFLDKSYAMLHYTDGQVRKVALPVPSGMTLQLASAAAVPGEPLAYAAGGAWPANGPSGSYTQAVILAYGS